MGRVVDRRLTLKAGLREKATGSRGRKAAVLDTPGHVSRTPPGSASGACRQRGRSGTWASPRSPGHMSGVGHRATNSPGVPWRLPPRHAPLGDTTPRRQPARDSGRARRAPRAEQGRRAVVAAPRTDDGGGTQAHGTPGRAGDAGYQVELESPTGETLSAPPVTPTRPRRAAQAAGAPARVCTPLAPRIAEDGWREAYRHTRPSRAPGMDGVTAAASAAPRDEHLRARPARRRSGRSQAAPVEPVWSETEDGSQRPIGHPAGADQLVQRAVARLLAALDAPAVLACAEGVRPGRRPHEARHVGRERCRQAGMGGAWRQRGVATSRALTGLAGARACASGSMRGVSGVSWARGGPRASGTMACSPTRRPASCQAGAAHPVLAHI